MFVLVSSIRRKTYFESERRVVSRPYGPDTTSDREYSVADLNGKSTTRGIQKKTSNKENSIGEK